MKNRFEVQQMLFWLTLTPEKIQVPVAKILWQKTITHQNHTTVNGETGWKKFENKIFVEFIKYACELRVYRAMIAASNEIFMIVFFFCLHKNREENKR